MKTAILALAALAASFTFANGKCGYTAPTDKFTVIVATNGQPYIEQKIPSLRDEVKMLKACVCELAKRLDAFEKAEAERQKKSAELRAKREKAKAEREAKKDARQTLQEAIRRGKRVEKKEAK